MSNGASISFQSGIKKPIPTLAEMGLYSFVLSYDSASRPLLSRLPPPVVDALSNHTGEYYRRAITGQHLLMKPLLERSSERDHD
jgi:hypothetical protein